MELSWGLLLGLAVAAGAVAFWLDALAARERANDAAQDTCSSTGAALLDGTVAFARLRIVRSDDGIPTLERTYLFDYSTDGVTRRQGFVVVTGGRVDGVGLQ